MTEAEQRLRKLIESGIADNWVLGAGGEWSVRRPGSSLVRYSAAGLVLAIEAWWLDGSNPS